MLDRGDDEREEWRRLELERSRLAVYDRLYKELDPTLAGDRDRRKDRRSYRVLRAPLSMHLRTRAIVNAIIERDHHDSLPAFFEVAMLAYLEKYGPLDDGLVPKDEELVRRHLEQKDKHDAE